MHTERWPALPLDEWRDTYATLHMWIQIIGKVRLAHTPRINHWWNVPLYVSARGLTTSVIHQEDLAFQIDFDFVDHKLSVDRDDGKRALLPLRSISVAAFYREATQTLTRLGIESRIWPVPVEVPDPVRFDQNDRDSSYDPEYVNRFWRILVAAERVLTSFRSRFIGKCSPVHFFWGSFDLAVTRFSGRRAPERKDADAITREAYSHEVISHGFWPGNRASGPLEGVVCAPAFYSYTAPAPSGLDAEPVRPANAFFSKTMGEFILLYDDVREADSPETALMEFLESTYDAGADLAEWDRAALERPVA